MIRLFPVLTAKQRKQASRQTGISGAASLISHEYCVTK